MRFLPAVKAASPGMALICLLACSLVCGLESLIVQSITIYHRFSWDLLLETADFSLLCLDFAAPLAAALISRRLLALYLLVQTVASSVLLHYGSFFYNTLTLSTIYHSMQGLSYLGGSVLSFLRVEVILSLGAVFLLKAMLLLLSRRPNDAMPVPRQTRIILALCLIMGQSLLLFFGHGRTGIHNLWAMPGDHQTAVERRTQDGTEKAVRSLGYMGTWLGEWISGVYKDTSLIYAENTCPDPHASFLVQKPDMAHTWEGLPMPPKKNIIVMVQVESLDYAALSLDLNGHEPAPFLKSLLPQSLLIKTFAPHKVGSANSDYELLNSRIADQNVMYYSYIRSYPDSVIKLIEESHSPAAFHGMEGNLFNLRGAYKLMGFKKLAFKEELLAAGYPPSTFTMEHIADTDLLDAAARYLEGVKEGDKAALFVITMSSHIPFLEPRKEFGLPRGMFSRYMASLRYADDCLRDFYARLPQGTLLLLWGDHSCDISYARGFPDNGKHVPFIAHVKGEHAWLKNGDLFSTVLEKDQYGEAAALSVAHGRRVYTLCELSHFLRRILSQP